MAESDILHGQILRSLGILEGKTDAGFSGIAQRLDTLNSKVAKHEGQFTQLAVQDGKMEVFLDGIKKLQDSGSLAKDKWIDRAILGVIGIVLQLMLIVLIRTGVVSVETTIPQSTDEIQERAIELRAEVQKLEEQLKGQQDI